MACLLAKDGVTSLYLLAHHSFGRLAHSVDTVIDDPVVSRVHAVIEWESNKWKIIDLSRNGIWVNSRKLDKQYRQALSSGDKIQFGSASGDEFKVVDVDAPCDFLQSIPPCPPEMKPTQPLQLYNLLPNESHPEIALYLEYSCSQWCLEPVESEGFEARIVKDGEFISFADSRWQLHLNRAQAETVEIQHSSTQIRDIAFIFHLSQDEETTQLILNTEYGQIDFSHRTHHYLTLTLARQKAADASAGIPASEQGWIYTELLAKALGLSETHLNIQIHRARKQLTEALNYQLGADNFIQRLGGKVRLGAAKFEVFKGGELECSLNPENIGVVT